MLEFTRNNQWVLTEFNSDFNSDLMKGKDIDLYSWASY